MNHHHHTKSKTKEQLERIVAALDHPDRLRTTPPEELLQLLSLKKTDSILDIGAGTGYFTIPAAKMVDNKVYALDMDHHMLDIIKKKAAEHDITNIQVVESNLENLPLTDESIDVIIASLVLHEVPDLPQALNKLNQVLKSNGKFFCLEIEPQDETKKVPRIASSYLEKELENLDFTLLQKKSIADNLYLIIAKKK
ncbi:class I SAM-dependent methyltransferase [Bacillus sp. B1-b2]|uniref:class I SAM-dependent methyltransferase n=1 Tax=Bacillus sp. B1-b2 TaxID=2653201 RepID=UPI0012624F06|nr:class I SAM-dependent methyltransferase [Bacillus sp. B1-b2]KAB7671265.1 class I SAM-dependent methyltransferase [Bacillus sp. B1-b2]